MKSDRLCANLLRLDQELRWNEVYQNKERLVEGDLLFLDQELTKSNNSG
jgi:hypothetical protein